LALTCSCGRSPGPEAIAKEYPDELFGTTTTAAVEYAVRRVVTLVFPPVICNLASVPATGVTFIPTLPLESIRIRSVSAVVPVKNLSAIGTLAVLTAPSTIP
jgi:hypothetical protein